MSDPATPAALLARLRADAPAPTDPNRLYEDWVSRERWPLDETLVALLAGGDPGAWPWPLDGDDAVTLARQLLARMHGVLAVDAGHGVDPLAVRCWAEGASVPLPSALAALLDFVQRTLPTRAAAPSRGADPAAAERERLLGLALKVLAREGGQCHDAAGALDLARLATRVLARAVAAEGPPPTLGPAELVALFTRHLD